MGVDDRIQNKTEDLIGRGKEAMGAVTGDDSLKAEGKAEQAKASVMDKIEDVKDKVKKKVDDVL